MRLRVVILVVLAIVIVLAARFVTSWQRFPVCCRAESIQGDRYAAIVFSDTTIQVYHTSPATNRSRLIAESRWPIDHLKVLEAHKWLVIVDRATIRVVNPLASKNQIWADLHWCSSGDSELICSAAWDVIVVIGDNTRDQSLSGQQSIRIYRCSDGKVLYGVNATEIDRVTVNDDLILCEYDDRVERIKRADEGVDVSVFHGPALQSELTRTQADAQVWQRAKFRSKSWSQGLLSRWISSPTFVALLSPVIAVLMLIWTRLFITAKAAFDPWWHVYLHLAIFLGLLFLIGVPIGTRYFDVSGGEIRNTLPRYILIASAQAIGFQLLLRIHQRRQIWIAIFSACAIPLLFFPMLLAAILRGQEIADARHNAKGSPFRFGILEMLLATAGIAILIQVGRVSLPIFWVGIPMTLHIGIGFLLSWDKMLSWATLFVCVPVITWILSCQQQFNGTHARFDLIIYLMAVPMVFAFMGLYDQYEFKRVTPASGEPHEAFLGS